MSEGMTEGTGWLDYTVTYLEMTARPTWQRPAPPSARAAPGFALIRAEDPPARWFFHLYDSVGAHHEWTDWRHRPRAELDALLADSNVAIYTAMLKGWTSGFFMLDWREETRCDLMFFGLAPEAQGRGLGGYLLQTAILTGWAANGVSEPISKMTVETCTLDHPRALPLYQRHGFTPVHREAKRRRASAPFQLETAR